MMVLLLYSYTEMEQNFMDHDSKDDLISSVRNACEHMCIHTYVWNGLT